MYIAVQLGVALEDVECVISVQRCHATHENGGLHGVMQSVIGQSLVLHNYNLQLSDGPRCAVVWPGWWRRAHCCQ